VGGESEDKPLPPSEKKLRDARKKGQVPQSKDFVSSMGTLAAIGFIAARVSSTFDLFAGLLDSADDLLDQPIAVALHTFSSQILVTAVNIVAPLFVLLLLSTVLASFIATGGPALSLEPLMPKPQKLNPVEGFKKLFSIRSLIELVKSLFKLVVIVTIAYFIIRDSLAALVELPSCGLECSAPFLRASLLPLVGSCVIVFLVFGFADLGLQHWLHIRDMRMSLTEQKNERKNTDGNPLIRSAHKRERREASRLRAGMNQATFVVTGARVSVAMRYDAKDTRVPMPVARAEGDDVLDFIQDARRHKLPIVHDPRTARAIFDDVQIGETIPRALLQTVIACMNEADAMRG
jgi:type III secretion protein U